jgi:hypothetical protein
MLSATCLYASCDDNYKFMDVLRAQIRMWKSTFKAEFQCIPELFKLCRHFRPFTTQTLPL